MFEGYMIAKSPFGELHFFAHPQLDPAWSDHGAYLRGEPAEVHAFAGVLGGVGLPAAGIPRYVPPKKCPWGMVEASMVDADGNLLRIGYVVTAVEESAPRGDQA